MAHSIRQQSPPRSAATDWPAWLQFSLSWHSSYRSDLNPQLTFSKACIQIDVFEEFLYMLQIIDNLLAAILNAVFFIILEFIEFFRKFQGEFYSFVLWNDKNLSDVVLLPTRLLYSAWFVGSLKNIWDELFGRNINKSQWKKGPLGF